ncbi:MAG: hypothetical protein WKF37_14155, partial [Bryobacteraceae bacterium]
RTVARTAKAKGKLCMVYHRIYYRYGAGTAADPRLMRRPPYARLSSKPRWSQAQEAVDGTCSILTRIVNNQDRSK